LRTDGTRRTAGRQKPGQSDNHKNDKSHTPSRKKIRTNIRFQMIDRKNDPVKDFRM